MATFVRLVLTLLLANALIAFVVFFYFHALAIIKVIGTSSGPEAYEKLRWFIAGETFVPLKKKWGRALAYVVVSYLALFVVLGVLWIFAPELTRW